MPGGGGGRTYDGDKGDVTVAMSPWEWRRDGDVALERARALSRKEGEGSSPGEVDGVTKVFDISRRGTGIESFPLGSGMVFGTERVLSILSARVARTIGS